MEMDSPGKATWLRIYIGESDQWHHRPLHLALVEFLRRRGLAGATVLRAVEGFGAHSKIHAAQILRLSEDLPMIIEVVDDHDQIEAILPEMSEMVQEGLILTMEVDVRLYRHRNG